MQKAKNYRNLILGCCMTGIVMLLAFFFLYHTYIQDIIYEERLNQMEEVTRQMFQNLEDVIDSHWDRVTEECNYLRDANIQTTDELCRHMKKKYELSAYADHKITLMAVDSEGGYYTESGKRGLFRDLDYFEESPEKTSFVFDSMTDNQSKMVFLNRLPEPIYLQNGEKKTSILYFGIAQDMEQLNPYFNCEAYNGNNSVYVLDDNGSKLFNSNQVELIKGHNVFSVLQNMKYLHNSSFEKTKAELEEKGCSYSNAVLDGTEYFYGLKRMENAEWTLIFLVPAEYVATNTLELVNFIMIFIAQFHIIRQHFNRFLPCNMPIWFKTIIRGSYTYIISKRYIYFIFCPMVYSIRKNLSTRSTYFKFSINHFNKFSSSYAIIWSKIGSVIYPPIIYSIFYIIC